MALVLSGSIDISGSMTATTIVVSAPGVAGMVSSSAQITELAPLMAYTASLKGAAIVSSSQQVQNYFTFARTGSVNTFFGNQGISGSLNVTSATGTNVTPQLTVTNTTTNGYGILRLVGAARGGIIDFYNTSSAQASITANDGALSFYINGDSTGTADATLNSSGVATFFNNVRSIISSPNCVGDDYVNVFKFVAITQGGISQKNSAVNLRVAYALTGGYGNEHCTYDLVASCSNGTWTIHTDSQTGRVANNGGNFQVSAYSSGDTLYIRSRKENGGGCGYAQMNGTVNFAGCNFSVA